MNEMLEYFAKPGFRRMLQAVRRKYRSLGRLGGRVQLRELTSEEREVLAGFLGRNLAGQSGLTVDVAEVDRIMRASRFAAGLEELLPEYFREELKSNQDIVREKLDRWERFFNEISLLAVRAKTREWLRVLKEAKESGYRTFLSLYNEDREEADRVLRICVRALDELPVLTDERCRRPVFAARLTGDPHGLDRGTWAGRLLYAGILYVLGNDSCCVQENRHHAETVRAVFRRAGLEEDDLSSNVIAAGLRTLAGDARDGMFDNARETGTPLILPLRFFELKTAWFPFRAVYVVENPTVLSAVLDAWDGPDSPPIICPSGQPSVAALKLLDELAAAGAKIHYSGDFDGKGLEIGVGLWNRYKDAFVPLLFDTRTYNSAPAGTKLTGEQRKRIAALQVPWNLDLPEAILRRGYVVYQEALVEEMIRVLCDSNCWKEVR